MLLNAALGSNKISNQYREKLISWFNKKLLFSTSIVKLQSLIKKDSLIIFNKEAFIWGWIDLKLCF